MEVKVVVGKLEQKRSEFKVKADQFQYFLGEEKKEVRRCEVRIEELDQMYEEMRLSCNDMEEEKEWAEERLESRKEDCWKLLEGKRRLRAEIEELTSYLEEYRTQLQDCRRERDDLKEKLAKSEGETKVAKEELVKYKRKWIEERKDHRLVAAELEEKNARLAKREAEYGGVKDVIKLVNAMQELRRRAQMRRGDDPTKGTEELRNLPLVIEQDSEIRSIMGRRGWLASHVTNLKGDLTGIADKAEGEHGFMLQDLRGLWVETEARIERMHEDTIAFIV